MGSVCVVNDDGEQGGPHTSGVVEGETLWVYQNEPLHFGAQRFGKIMATTKYNLSRMKIVRLYNHYHFGPLDGARRSFY